ncbi:hypothetical protein [Paraburkholderia kururiensis]|nr:hypothetical protein [Paraburkholderia kururiensis]
MSESSTKVYESGSSDPALNLARNLSTDVARNLAQDLAKTPYKA